jgi:GTP-binding protein HflX
MAKNLLFSPIEKLSVLAVGVYAPYNKTHNIDGYYQEFLNLVSSNGIEPVATTFIKLRSIDPGYFITSGKLDEILKIVNELGIQQVILSEPITSRQEKNLSEMLNCQVFDRTQLILEIFEKGAHSAEGKIQVSLALLQHKKARLAGKGIDMAQQWGMIGSRGPGETAKERESQHIKLLIETLQKELKQLEKQRQTQRKQRLANRVPHICLIGYTNAGKSTLLNTLTHAETLAEDKLFATLDTTTRELYINKKKIGLLSDTVGFIQELPTTLIEAFKSTLAELQYADLLLQIIDASDPNFQAHIRVVDEILKELEVNKPMLFVFNKIDKVADKEKLEHFFSNYQPHICTNATSKEGLADLLVYIEEWAQKRS